MCEIWWRITPSGPVRAQVPGKHPCVRFRTRYRRASVQTATMWFTTGTNSIDFSLILRYCLSTGITDLVSRKAVGLYPSYDTFRNLVMTPNGRFVATIVNLNNNPPKTSLDLWDGQTGTNIFSTSDTNFNFDGECESPAVSPDGRYIAFICGHMYLRDVVRAGRRQYSIQTHKSASQSGSLARSADD